MQRYQKVQKIESITFCGGEVFLLNYFTELINELTSKKIFVQIISNGTIDRLKEITKPNMVNLIISLDGLKDYHDQNRGAGNFDKSTSLLKKALTLGFHTEIFSIVTKENLKEIPKFEKELKKICGQEMLITYHPRKPKSYLKNHPISNILGTVKNFNFLNEEELIELMKNRKTFPPQDLGCYQISLMSDGKIYSCCEGISSIGNIQTDAEEIINNFKNRLSIWDEKNYNKKCLGCTEKNFVCGLQNILKN